MTRKRPGVGSGVHRAVAGIAVKVAAVFELDGLKTFGNAFDANILCPHRIRSTGQTLQNA
jgi:hypothetical protein